MNKIDNLTEDEILNGHFPLEDLLKNSFYYPSSGFDGGIGYNGSICATHFGVTVPPISVQFVPVISV